MTDRVCWPLATLRPLYWMCGRIAYLHVAFLCHIAKVCEKFVNFERIFFCTNPVLRFFDSLSAKLFFDQISHFAGAAGQMKEGYPAPEGGVQYTPAPAAAPYPAAPPTPYPSAPAGPYPPPGGSYQDAPYPPPAGPYPPAGTPYPAPGSAMPYPSGPAPGAPPPPYPGPEGAMPMPPPQGYGQPAACKWKWGLWVSERGDCVCSVKHPTELYVCIQWNPLKVKQLRPSKLLLLDKHWWTTSFTHGHKWLCHMCMKTVN